jgi:hypothetical protein
MRILSPRSACPCRSQDRWDSGCCP